MSTQVETDYFESTRLALRKCFNFERFNRASMNLRTSKIDEKIKPIYTRYFPLTLWRTFTSFVRVLHNSIQCS